MDDTPSNDVHSSGKLQDEKLTVDDSERLLGQLFSSREEAWNFYKEYAMKHGFSARRGTTRLDGEGNVKTQEFCCSKEGVRSSKVETVNRQRAHMPVTRTVCKEKIVVTATKTNDQWVLRKSFHEHNHALCTPVMTPFMRSNRAVSEADVAEATALKDVGVGTSQVMNYFMNQAWGYHNVGFTSKDMYNALERGKAKDIVNGDVNALIAYFDYKKEDDPGFFMTYSTDESGALQHLIWADSTSRSDYTCFGDVIAFDTTYKGNYYGRPIMPIVGVNHHHSTIVFATATIADETTQSFEWVLRNFLQSMMNKSPLSVVTDGDRAMQRAIKCVFPYAKHILCSWHLSRNVQANIGDSKFSTAFTRCMSSWWTTEEFDIEWSAMISEFNVGKHPWVIEKGNTRNLWAQAFQTGHFFANLRSTQRCESLNASLRRALIKKKTYVDVVRTIEQAISKMRINELKADYLSSQTMPFQITKLTDLESHAGEIYTRASFRLFQEELQDETLYRIEEQIQSLSDECQNFVLSKYKGKNTRFHVCFDVVLESVTCSCRKFETVGIPCCHQLHVLKHLDYTSLPKSLILSRWTKDAKDAAPSFLDFNVAPEVMQMARFAALRATSSRFCCIASKTDASFITPRDEMKRLTTEFEHSFGLKDSSKRSSVDNGVRDPKRRLGKRKEVQNKKVQKKSRLCSFYKIEGHNKVTCPKLKLRLDSFTQPTSTEFFDNDMEWSYGRVDDDYNGNEDIWNTASTDQQTL